MLVYFINVSALAFIFSCQQDTIIPWQHSVPSPLSLPLKRCYIAVLGRDGRAFLSCISHCFSDLDSQQGTEQRWQRLKSNVFMKYLQFWLLLKKTPTLTTALYYYDFKHHWEGIKLKCMGCTCNAALRPRGAPGSSGTQGLWEVMERWEAALLPRLWGPCLWHGRVPTACSGPGRSENIQRFWDRSAVSIFFSEVQGCVHQGQGQDPNPSVCAPSKGMRSADPAGSVRLNRPECLRSVARWAVQGLRQSSLKSMRAFPLISRTLD